MLKVVPAGVMNPRRNYRLVAEDGVASAAELQADYEASLRRRREHGAAPTTVEALLYSLRERGEAALRERDVLHRLSELSTNQVREVVGRLMRLRPKYSAITDQLLFLLSEQLR